MLKFKYDKLSPELEKRIKEDNGRYIPPYACRDENAVRRDMTRDVSSALRPAFSRDIDKIINCPYFNRYCRHIFGKAFIYRANYTKQNCSAISQNSGLVPRLRSPLERQ